MEANIKSRMTQNAARSIVILLALGCAGRQVPSPSPTVPSAERANVSMDSGPWNFAYRSDTLSYQINRSAAIETQTDSGARHEVTTNASHEVLSLTITDDTIRYTATVDTFSTTTQDLIGTVPPTTPLPLEISGVLDPTTPQLDSSALVQSCDPVLSSLQRDVRNLLISFPARFAIGSSWHDSTTSAVCYGTVPLTATVVRKFSVVGRTSYNGASTVAIQRIDSITAHGEGRQQQHRVVVDVSGTGTAMYYLSSEQSSVLHLITNQDLEFVIQISPRMRRFHESAKEEYSLVR